MSLSESPRVGYVVKRYPRFSETFIVNEILAHEAAGMEIEIFALRPTVDTHFQDAIARVRAGVTYLPDRGLRASDMWTAFEAAGDALEGFWQALGEARGAEARDVVQAAVLARHARERGIDHLHAHFGSSATTVARLAARFAGLTYSFTAHAKDIFHESVSPEAMARNLRDAATVITVSDYNVDYLRETYGPAAARVQRVYNGIELDRFRYQPPSSRPPRIVAVGRLVEKKGFDVLIDACAIMAGKGLEFHCQIVGTGELEAELRAQIERLGVGSHVEMTGPRPQREVIDLVQDAAVFAAPCVNGSDGNRDGLPTVLLEAMALGTPSVSTDVTGIPEVLRHDETGLMVPQHDPVSLADALERLLDDADLRLNLAAQARQAIERDFDIHRNAATLRTIFKAVAGVAVPIDSVGAGTESNGRHSERYGLSQQIGVSSS